MNKNIIDKIEVSLLKIKAKIPSPKRIQNYTEFIQVKNRLKYNLFSVETYISLVRLTNTLWKSKKPVSRMALLKALDFYFKNASGNIEFLSDSDRKEIFRLYKSTIEDCQYLNPKKIEDARKIANRLMRNLCFETEDEKWLCNQVINYPHVLEVIFYYPKKSSVFQNWVKDNFLKFEFRVFRAELLSYLFDEDEDYIFDPFILLDDFKSHNRMDKKIIEDFKLEYEAFELLKIELKGLTTDKIDYPKELEWLRNDFEYEGLHYPVIKFVKRTYPVPTVFSYADEIYIPDFKKLKKYFSTNFFRIYFATVLQGIAFSRLDKSKKIKLLKKYCYKESIQDFIKIGEKFKLEDALIWLRQLA